MAKVKRKRDSKVEHRVFSQPKGTAAPGGRGQRRLREAIVIINPKQMQSWASLTVPVQEHGQGEASCFSSRIGYSSEVAPDRWERTSLSGDIFQNYAGTNSVFLDWTHLLEFCCCYCCGLIFSLSSTCWLCDSAYPGKNNAVSSSRSHRRWPFLLRFDVSWIKSKYLSHI